MEYLNERRTQSNQSWTTSSFPMLKSLPLSRSSSATSLIDLTVDEEHASSITVVPQNISDKSAPPPVSSNVNTTTSPPSIDNDIVHITGKREKKQQRKRPPPMSGSPTRGQSSTPCPPLFFFSFNNPQSCLLFLS
jgi:hypothetical protein